MLQKLAHLRDGSHEETLDIIIIPTIGLSRPSAWLDVNGSSWLHKLVEDTVPETDLWEYIYDDNKQGLHSQRMLAEGIRLLDALYHRCTRDRPKRIPVIFICHGMGAFALKHALCICRAQHFQYRPIIDAVAGAIFLGCPHFSNDRKAAKSTLDLLLRCQRKGIGRDLSSDVDAEEYISICQSFERLSFKVPIISAWESEETPTQSNMFSKFRGKGRNQKASPAPTLDHLWERDLTNPQQIVPMPLGILRADTETPIDGKSNHFQICNVLVGSDLYNAAVRLVKDVMKEAPQRILEANRPYTIPVGLRDDTLRSLSTAGASRMERDDEMLEQVSLPVSSPHGATGGSSISSAEIVPAQVAMEPSQKDPTLPCFSMGTHSKLDRFVGRQDLLDEIDRHLLPPAVNLEAKGDEQSSSDGGDEVHSFAICGLGGMGKTQLAIQYAYTRRTEYDAIFWLHADDAKILATDFAKIAQHLGLEDGSSDIAVSRDIAMRWLAQPLRKMSEPETPANFVKWLLIFDNVDDINVLSEFWPKLGRGSVLVTSRDPFAKHNLYMQHGTNLTPLTKSETEKLIQRLTHVRVDPSQKEHLSLIAGKLGGLPLAIHLMSGVFRQLRLSYADFLNVSNNEGIVKLFKGPSSNTNSEEVRSLATVWALDRLSEKTRVLLQVICLLDPDDIPETLLIDTSDRVKLASYPKTIGEYYAARAELLASSLIYQNTELNRLSMHRLVQDTTKDSMEPSDLVSANLAAFSLMMSSWPFQDLKEHHSVARFGSCELLFPSVLRLKDGLESLLKTDPSFPLSIRMARLFNDVGWYMFERGLPEETKPFCAMALTIGGRISEQSDETAADAIRESHSFLGIALVETNEHALSMTHKRKWLDMLLERKSSSGEIIEDYELGYGYNEIGVALGNVDQLDHAAAAFHRSIEIFQGLQDYEETMLGWPEPNLGFIFWMQNKLDDAERALVEILDIHAAAYGVDDTKSFKTGKILYGMGNVTEAQGRHDESFDFHKRCFTQFKAVLGTGHHRVGDICHKLAGHCIRQGLHAEALGYLDAALGIFSSRPYLANELARTTNRKSIVLRVLGRNGEADDLQSNAYAIRRSLRPRDNRPVSALREHDFDELVAFWSR